ncbi:MAG: hypothetical protein P0111_00450 [Nitrospira sp.]|nr:hypothetical protein [Nitrospira sp.]
MHGEFHYFRQPGNGRPDNATLPFTAAKTASARGHDVVLWLWNEAERSFSGSRGRGMMGHGRCMGDPGSGMSGREHQDSMGGCEGEGCNR